MGQWWSSESKLVIDNENEEKEIEALVFAAKMVRNGSSESKLVIDIENEAMEIEALVFAAKMGRWNQVWDILGTPLNPRKSYLINVIPQSRRWGVLHQAVYWNDLDILRNLLKFKDCDSNLKAKTCLSECGKTDRMNANEIADNFKYMTMSTILSNHVNSVRQQTIPTFQPYDGYCDNSGMCLLTLTLASYKQAFHPASVDPNKPVLDLLNAIYNDICRGDGRWKKVQEVVADSVYAVSIDLAKCVLKCKDRSSFFREVIRSYTRESTIYTDSSMAFRRQREQSYSPSGDDLAMGPYCVMFQMLLLYWDKLEKESEKTYRKMTVTTSDANKYTPGTRFVWQSSVSSALNEDIIHAFPKKVPTGNNTIIIFTIFNSTESKWQPRNIENVSKFKTETERVYPAGSKFLVKSKTVKAEIVYVNLELLET